jgi:predicted RNA-binding protein with TRAM domain
VAISPGVSVLDTSQTPRDITITADKTSADEGDTIRFTVTAKGVADGQVLLWGIYTAATTEPGWNTMNPNDDFAYYNPLVRGAFYTAVINNETCSFSLIATKDHTTEGTESFRIISALQADLSAADQGLLRSSPYVYSNTFYINDTSQDLTCRIEVDQTTVNEGDTVTFTLTTTGVEDGTRLYWGFVTPLSPGFNPSTDLVGWQPTIRSTVVATAVTVTNNTAVIPLEIRQDVLTEGREFFTLGVYTELAKSFKYVTGPTVTIEDTSITVPKTWSVVPDRSTVEEGSTVTFTVTTTGVVDGTQSYWQASTTGVTVNEGPATIIEGFRPNTPWYGTLFTVTNNTAVIPIKIRADYSTRTVARTLTLYVGTDYPRSFAQTTSTPPNAL